MIHGHGDDLYQTHREIKANFSTNVWYEADTKPLCCFLENHLDRIFHYPEPDARSFCEVVAAYHGIDRENVLAGNGATELFYLIAHAFAGTQTIIPIPSFTEYQDACGLYSHHIIYVQEPDLCQLPEESGLMFICNPNNPDGRIWTEEEIILLLDTYPDMVLVVDESFIHFAPEAKSALSLLNDHPNLLLVKSMTKCYSIPGLRLGYVLGDPGLINFIRCFGQPWSVNALAIEAGKYLLQQGDENLPDAAMLLKRQRSFAGQISKITGFRPFPSHTSFFLVQTDYDASQLKQYLLQQQGILIRDASNFRGLDGHYFRVNTLTDEKNQLLIKALNQYVASFI